MNKYTAKLVTLTLFVTCSLVVSAQQQQSIRIIRDNYGIPHIYADDTYSLFYGYGYVVGQDRLFQMEMMKRTTAGRVSEVLGEEYLQLDKTVRQGFNPASLQQQIELLTDDEMAVFGGYADGINGWIAEVNKNPNEFMPKEFIDYGFKPSSWSAYDVILLVVGSMAHRYADFNEEINNLVFYQQLLELHDDKIAWQIFNATLPIYDPSSPTTVPDSEAQSRKVGFTGAQAPAYLKQLLKKNIKPIAGNVFDRRGQLLSVEDEQQRQDYFERHFSLTGVSGRAGFSSTSNVWLVNKNKVTDADGVLVNGPQFGWINPSYVYGVGLHGAGFDVVGNTLLAYPFMLFSHNGDISWGSTAGFGDLVDIYVNQINPENTAEYLYQGKYHTMEQRQESFQQKNGKIETEIFYQTVHGPVILHDKVNGYVYSKKRSWAGSEVATAVAWVELAKAKDYQAWREQLARMSTNINFYFLDKSGNIAYTHSGKYPLRRNGHDNRLPVIGDGSMDWQGYRPFVDNPYVYNPRQGFIVNWNNRPEHGWPNSDLWWRRWGKAERVDVLLNELSMKETFNSQELWEINSRSSFADVNIQYLLPWLKQSLRQQSAGERVMQALSALEQWNGFWQDEDNDGKFDTAAPLIMQIWLKTLLVRVLHDDVGEKNFFRFASPGYPIEPIRASIAVSPGIKVIVNNLMQLETKARVDYDFFNGREPGDVIAKSFIDTIEALADNHGHDQSYWSLDTHPLIFSRFNFRGVEQTTEDNQPSLPVIMNRGSENNLFIAQQNELKGWDVFAPGQSGFVDPKGNKSPHYSDQLELYWQFKNKPLPFTPEQVEAMKKSEFILRLQ